MAKQQKKTHEKKKDDVQASTPQGQVLNNPEYDQLPPKSPKQRYLILSSPRTGSNYICRRLCNIKDHFGMPSEYLNQVNIRALAPRLCEIKEGEQLALGLYLESLESVRTTTDGFFGLKVQPKQLLAVLGKKKGAIQNFINRFDRVIFMTRSDKLGQAISGAIAQVTGKWFNDKSEPDFDEANLNAMMPLIARNLSHYIDEENFILTAAKNSSRAVMRVNFEEIEHNADEVFNSVVRFLGRNLADLHEDHSLTVMPERPEGIVAAKLREKFLIYISGKN